VTDSTGTLKGRATGLDPAFVRFWCADAVSNLGTFVSTLAIQLLLIETMHADQTAVGIVRAAQWAPYLLFGLLAGVVVDRVRRRRLLVLADIVSALALGAAGVLAMVGTLTVPLLALLIFVAGAASMFFATAHQSFLPSLVGPAYLPTAWARLEQTYSVTQSAGPLVAGALVRLLSAPVAILVDAVSYAVSAMVLGTIRAEEAKPRGRADSHVLRELKEGAAWVYRHPVLGLYAVSLHLTFFFNSVVTTVLVYFASTELGLDALSIGFVLAAVGVTGVVGAGLSPRLGERLGPGALFAYAAWLGPAAYALLLPARPGAGAMWWLVASSLVFGLGSGLSGPVHVSYRNVVTPDRLRGRMNATIRTFNWGSIAVAAPLGGWIAAEAGNRTAFAVGIAGLVVAATVATFSPVRRAEWPRHDEPEHGHVGP
jgi:MFS family permease